MNNEFVDTKKIKKPVLKRGMGEFYGGSHIHITDMNDLQSEKNKYIPFEGNGHSLLSNTGGEVRASSCGGGVASLGKLQHPNVTPENTRRPYVWSDVSSCVNYNTGLAHVPQIKRNLTKDKLSKCSPDKYMDVDHLGGKYPSHGNGFTYHSPPRRRNIPVDEQDEMVPWLKTLNKANEHIDRLKEIQDCRPVSIQTPTPQQTATYPQKRQVPPLHKEVSIKSEPLQRIKVNSSKKIEHENNLIFLYLFILYIIYLLLYIIYYI